tara:strand:+ start:439 stop:738 length:300 start_codon:yes stop_codon:yes gene_type:complete
MTGQNGSLARIVQFSDDTKTLPDGSKVIYAESEDKIVLYHKVPFESGATFIFERQTGQVTVNGNKGSAGDKRRMLQLGSYFLENVDNADLVTIQVQPEH